MTTPRENLLKVLRHERPEWIPVAGHCDPYNQPSRESMDPALAYLWADAPAALRDCFAVMEANYLQRLKVGVQSDIDVVVSVDDTSTTAISPAMFEACNLDLTNARADAAHAAGDLPFRIGDHDDR